MLSSTFEMPISDTIFAEFYFYAWHFSPYFCLGWLYYSPYGRGFSSLFFRYGILSFAALVKSSAFLSADTVSEIRSAVSKFRALILNDCQSAFDRINFSQSSTSSAGNAFMCVIVGE